MNAAQRLPWSRSFLRHAALQLFVRKLRFKFRLLFVFIVCDNLQSVAMAVEVSYAPHAWRMLNGVFCIFKEAGQGYNLTKNGLTMKLAHGS